MERFGFTTTPFTNELAAAKRLRFDHIEAEVSSLRRAVDERLCGLVIAPAGGGKSVVLRALTDSLPAARFRTHYIKVTALAARDLCREIAYAVGAKPVGTYPALVRAIQDHFEQTTATDGLRPVVLVDEAQDLKPQALSVFKLLTNFEMDSRRVVSIVLAGQPGLKNILYKPGMEDIRRRLAHCGELRLLSREETKGYIEHRVRLGGAQRVPFDGSAIEALYEMSRGNMGAVDLLALKALETANLGGKTALDANDVLAARKDVWI